MRLAVVFALLTVAAATSVASRQTNAERLARGLPPNPPARRGASNTDSAEHHHPSGKPHHKHHHGDGDDGNGDKDGHDGYETNAKRLARGLPPNPPVRRAASGTDSAEHHHPSGKPHEGGGDDGKGDGNYGETNAQRLARGLPPNPPVRRAASGTDSAEHHHPSGTPPHKHHGGGDDDGKCKTVVQCCNSVSTCDNPVVKTIAGLVKAKLPTDNAPVGLGCSAIGEHSCSSHTVCCENNDYGGVIAIGCVAINISV